MNKNSNKLISKEIFQTTQRKLEKNYRDFIEDLRLDFKNDFTTDVVDQYFLEQLSDILQDENLDHYSPLKFYWLDLIDHLIYVIQLHEELLTEEDLDNLQLEELENELHLLWLDSEFKENYQDFLSDGAVTIEASNNLIPLLENQIISFYVLHINSFRQEFADALIYHAIPEIGDNHKKIYIQDKTMEINLKDEIQTYPSFPLLSFDFDKKIISIENDKREISLFITPLNSKIQFDNFNLSIVPATEFAIKNIDHIKALIESAITELKSKSKDLYYLAKNFTHTLVVFNDEDFKSYSFQNLPGFTGINLKKNSSTNEIIESIVYESANHFYYSLSNGEDLINDDHEKYIKLGHLNELITFKEFFHYTFTRIITYELNSSIELKEELKVLIKQLEDKESKTRLSAGGNSIKNLLIEKIKTC